MIARFRASRKASSLIPAGRGTPDLRTLARATDGITAKVFSMLNELAVEAVRSRKEQITDEDVESWKPEGRFRLTAPNFWFQLGLGLASSPN